MKTLLRIVGGFASLFVMAMNLQPAQAAIYLPPTNFRVTSQQNGIQVLNWVAPEATNIFGYVLTMNCLGKGLGAQVFPPTASYTASCNGQLTGSIVAQYRTGGTSPSAPLNNATISITGTKAIGSTLTASLDGSAWSSATSISYSWAVDNNAGVSTKTFSVTNQNVNAKIELFVSATFPDLAQSNTYQATAMNDAVRLDYCADQSKCQQVTGLVRRSLRIPATAKVSRLTFTENGQPFVLPYLSYSNGTLTHTEAFPGVAWDTWVVTNVADMGDDYIEPLGNRDMDIYLLFDPKKFPNGTSTFGVTAEQACNPDLVTCASGDSVSVSKTWTFNKNDYLPQIGTVSKSIDGREGFVFGVPITWPQASIVSECILDWKVDGVLRAEQNIISKGQVFATQTIFLEPGAHVVTLTMCSGSVTKEVQVQSNFYVPTLSHIEQSQVADETTISVNATWDPRSAFTHNTFYLYVDGVQIDSKVVASGSQQKVSFTKSVPIGPHRFAVNVGSGDWIAVEGLVVDGRTNAELTSNMDTVYSPGTKIKLKGKLSSELEIPVTFVAFRTKTFGGLWTKPTNLAVGPDGTFTATLTPNKETSVEFSYFDPARHATIKLADKVLVAPKFSLSAKFASKKVGKFTLGGNWTFGISGPGGPSKCIAVLSSQNANSPLSILKFKDYGWGSGKSSSKKFGFTAQQKYNGYYSVTVECMFGTGYSWRTIKVQ